MGKTGMREREAGRRIVEMRNREVGALAPRSFFHRTAASLDIVLRLGIHGKLDKHRGCVNTVTFNASGNILVSGSDDRMVMLWDWEMGIAKLSFHSGHINNVFQAKFMPYTDDKTMVTCAADGEVRIAQLQDGGQVFTSMLAKHEGRAHKMAVEPGSPHILYSCGEDGLVYHFDLRTQAATKLFKCKTFKDKRYYMPIVHLNAIAIDPRNPNRFAVAGSDEFARVYDVRKCRWDGKECGNPADCFSPPHLIGDDEVGITGLAFSDQSELLVSYNFESIYLFSKDQGLGSHPDLITPSSTINIDSSVQTFEASSIHPSTKEPSSGEAVQAYNGHRNCETVKGAGFFGPNCEYVTSGSDCGRIFIWRKKGGELLRAMEGDRRVVNCIEPNPIATMLASCGIEKDIKIWVPNAEEPAEPVDIDEIMKQDPIRFFSRDDFDFEVDDSEDDNDDDDDDDGNSTDFLDVNVLSDQNSSDTAFNDESEEEDDDDDDDADNVDSRDDVINGLCAAK